MLMRTKNSSVRRYRASAISSKKYYLIFTAKDAKTTKQKREFSDNLNLSLRFLASFAVLDLSDERVIFCRRVREEVAKIAKREKRNC